MSYISCFRETFHEGECFVLVKNELTVKGYCILLFYYPYYYYRMGIGTIKPHYFHHFINVLTLGTIMDCDCCLCISRYLDQELHLQRFNATSRKCFVFCSRFIKEDVINIITAEIAIKDWLCFPIPGCSAPPPPFFSN